MTVEIDFERGLAVPPEIISDFQKHLSLIDSRKVYGLPKFGQQINHEGKYTRLDTRLSPGFFVDPSAFLDANNDESNIKPSSLDFQVLKLARTGRENSHNKVFFGELTTYGHND